MENFEGVLKEVDEGYAPPELVDWPASLKPKEKVRIELNEDCEVCKTAVEGDYVFDAKKRVYTINTQLLIPRKSIKKIRRLT